MVKTQSNWNDYVKNFEPFELEENYRHRTLMELFSLKFDFGARKYADISGEMTIMHYPIVVPLFRGTTNDFQSLSSGIFTPLNEGMELPIDATGGIRFKIDLIDKDHGALKFKNCFSFGLETETAEIQKVEDGGGGGDDDDEEEDYEEEISDRVKEKLAKFDELRKEIEAARAARHNRFDLWDGNRDLSRFYDKLLRKKFDSRHCSIEVMYAVYEDARAVTLEFTFADWKPGSLTQISNGFLTKKHICARNRELYKTISDGLHVFGKVTARNTLLQSDHATTVLFDRAIHNCVRLKQTNPIPISKTVVVFPRKSTLLLNIDLKRAVHKGSYEHNLSMLPSKVQEASPSEPLVTKTLEITNQSAPYRHLVDDGGPGKLFVTVTFHD